MNRCSLGLLLALLLLMGCGGERTTADGTPAVELPADCCAPPPERHPEARDRNSIDPADSLTVTDPGSIVTPTVDDSDERAKAREMDVAGLIAALNDPQLGTAASDELASRGDDAVKPLIDAIDSGDATTQQKAIFTLGQLGPAAKDALPRLKELADSGGSEVVQDSAKFAIDAIEGEGEGE